MALKLGCACCYQKSLASKTNLSRTWDVFILTIFVRVLDVNGHKKKKNCDIMNRWKEQGEYIYWNVV